MSLSSNYPTTREEEKTSIHRPIVYLGDLYHNTQQYSHFEEYYTLYQQLPPLVPNTDAMSQYTTDSSTTHESAVSSSSYHSAATGNQPTPKSFQTRVGTIPSFAPKNQSLRDMHFGTTTLALKLEPSIPSKVSSNSQRSSFDVSVFSGPHYQPEKYTVKTSTDYGNRLFLPEHFPPSATSLSEARYLLPSLDSHFQNALIDGSYFQTHSDYDAEDPENFRHAYGVKHQPSKCKCVESLKPCSATDSICNSNRPVYEPRWGEPIA